MSGEKPIGERVASLETTLESHHSWIGNIDTVVKDHEATLNKAKGGWILLCLLCGGSGAIGALIIKLMSKT